MFFILIFVQMFSAFALEFSPCHPKGMGMQVNCASVPVSIQTGQLELPLIYIPAVKNTKRSPIFLLAGGPGQAATEIGPLIFQNMHTLHTNHDILFLDQRGTGKTGLSCSEGEEKDVFDNFSSSIEEQQQELEQCLQKLSFDVVDYQTKKAAEDLELVRKEMGFSKIVLYGISYGTVLAQTYATLYPNHVAALVLDGVVDVYHPMGQYVEEDANRTWQNMIEICQQDGNCAKLEPQSNFETIFGNLPQEITIRHPRTFEQHTFVMQREGFLSMLRMLLYSTETIELLPLALKQASEGDWGHLITLSLQGGELDVSTELNLSIFCSESFAFWDTDGSLLKDSEPNLFDPQNPFQNQVRPFMGQMCQKWPRYDYQPFVASKEKIDIPILLFHGELDPITPAHRSEGMLERYTNIQSIIVPNKGHNVALTDCGTQMMVDFIQKYDLGDMSVEIPNCYQQRSLEFFHTVAGHIGVPLEEKEQELDREQP